jgi:NTP pyrophosphatase (non-canonical NTP hydrolase)
MRTNPKEQLLKDILASRGIGFFYNKMVEEMGELTQVLMKLQNTKFNSDDDPGELKEKVYEELGHVLAFAEVLKTALDSTKINVQKMNRIERFIKYLKK